jgi:hypothetical protein
MSLGKKGKGIFGNEVLKFQSDLPVEDESRLGDFTIRESFLTRIFAIAEFKEIEKTGKIKNLVDFHSRYKYLLMMYNQSQLKILGSTLATMKNDNQKKYLSCIVKIYEKLF